MSAFSWCLLLVTLASVWRGSESGSRGAHSSILHHSSDIANALQGADEWGSRGPHHRKHGGGRRDKPGGLSRRPPLSMARAEDDGIGLEGLSPVRLEMGPVERRGGGGGAARRDGSFLGFGVPFHEQDNRAPGSEGSPKGRRHGHQSEHRRHGHQSEHRRHGSRRDKARHTKGRVLRPELDSSFLEEAGLMEDHPSITLPSEGTALAISTATTAPTATPTATPTPTATIVSTSVSTVTTATSKDTSEMPSSSSKPQPHQGRVKAQGEVLPTLDMTLFDWTDYEDMKPADTWPSSKKKGSCCDLRQHECKPHNRGLNNKCYDDCMCEEGLRCYAKFHRKRRVTRRKGRCVEPETANSEQGAFITI
ncbi:hypothetical protein GJAV_G00187070 [Gymnothorax javanicus]|nr:hypothetical protein GJAV_G00187070 [Gymnothorax javanicus]